MKHRRAPSAVGIALAALLATIGSDTSSAASISLITWPGGSTEPWPNGSTTELRNRIVAHSPSDIMPGGGYVTTFDPISLPFVDSHTFDQGNAKNQTDYELTSQMLLIDFVEHMHRSRSWAISEGSIYFTVDENVPYILSGEFIVPAGGPSSAHLRVLLTEFSTGHLFSNIQSTVDTYSAKHFRLGEEGGTSNELEGSLTGILRAGVSYRLMYMTTIGMRGSATQNTATGFVLLMIPEPSTAFLVSMGLGGLAVGRRRNARRL